MGNIINYVVDHLVLIVVLSSNLSLFSFPVPQFCPNSSLKSSNGPATFGKHPFLVLHYPTLYYTSLWCIIPILYCTILYYTIMYYTILYYTVLYDTVLSCITPQGLCSALHCTSLRCTKVYIIH